MAENQIVYYRKYRPQRFEDIVGQESVVRVLKNAIAKNRVAHAYLFSGPRGCGKTTIARILAHSVGCAEEDIIEIDAASSRGIDEARALREAVLIMPLRSLFKVYIIDEVHMLTKEAFNVLLKTLEEPPKHVIFILATTDIEKVPETVASRTQHFKFSKFTISEIVKKLALIAKSEEFLADDDALKLIAFFSDGSLRDAENILLQVSSLGEKKITEPDVRLILGAPEEEAINNMIVALFKNDLIIALEIFDKILEKGVDPTVFFRLLLRNIRAIYFLTLDKNSEKLLEREFSKDEIALFNQFTSAGVKFAENAVRELLEASRYKMDDATASLPLELAIIKIAKFS